MGSVNQKAINALVFAQAMFRAYPVLLRAYHALSPIMRAHVHGILTGAVMCATLRRIVTYMLAQQHRRQRVVDGPLDVADQSPADQSPAVVDDQKDEGVIHTGGTSVKVYPVGDYGTGKTHPKTCKFFKNGFCRNGNNCHYKH
jgi:hypothetical protein